MDWKLWLGGIVAALVSFIVGKFWGAKKYDQGYQQGANDYIDDIQGKSEIAKAAIEAVDNVADKRERASISEAEQYFRSVIGRQPTPLELKQFHEEAEK